MIDERDIALSILMDIETHDTYSNIAIGKALHKIQFEDKSKRAFITRLSEGVVESRIKLDYIINQFSKTKINKCKPLIRCLLRMGVYQMLYMDSVADAVACNEAVRLAKKHNFAPLSGFVNGVLRSISRGKDDISFPKKEDSLSEYLSVEYSVPTYVVELLLKYYQEDKTEQILRAGFLERPTSIRVNETGIGSRQELRTLIEEKGITVLDGHYTDRALLIDGYDFIKKVPGYKKGYFTVQDESSICAIEKAFGYIDDIGENFVVLDICAAPGGKTTAALEHMRDRGRLYSMDISEDKLELIEENVERLGFENVEISSHDATKPFELVGGADLIIADLPCSGLGIMGRKNDIKYHISEEKIVELTLLQKDILDNASRYIKDNGILLYSTCTINPMENEQVADYFLEKHKDFIKLDSRLFIQGIDDCDGFFYTIFKKIA